MSESSFLVPAKAVHAAKLREGQTVADLGTGSGFFARAAARAVGPEGRVFAVDANRDLLTRLVNLAEIEGLRNIEPVVGDIERRGGTHLPDGEMDFVIASNVLFSAEDKPALAEEIWRVLTSHGVHTEAGRALIIDWKGSFGGLGPHPDHVISEDAAKTLFAKSGFVAGADVPAGEYHWGFIVRKEK